MKRLVALAIGTLLSGLLSMTALAAEGENPQAPQPAVDAGQVKKKVPAATKSKVPKARSDYYKKREEAKKRRDLMLKEREKNVEAGGVVK